MLSMEREKESIRRVCNPDAGHEMTAEALKDRELSAQLDKEHYDERRWNLIYTLDKVQAYLGKKDQAAPQAPSLEPKGSQHHRSKHQNTESEEPSHIFSFSTSKTESRPDSCSESERTLENQVLEDTTPFKLISDYSDESLYWVKGRPDGYNEDNLNKNIYDFVVGLTGSGSATQKTTLTQITDILKIHDSKQLSIHLRGFCRDLEDTSLSTRSFPEAVTAKNRKYIYRRALLVIAHLLKSMKHPHLHPAMPDLLVLHAFCRFLFEGNKFNPKVQLVEIRECDLTHFNKYLENSELKISDEEKVVETHKKYCM